MGPGDASGWYWTENTGRSLSRMPWTVPSNSERWVTSTFVGQAGVRHREAVVLAGDLDLAGGQVLDRVVGAVMAERHLLGPAAQRQPQHLVAEADAEHRLAAVDQLPDLRHGIARRSPPDRRGRSTSTTPSGCQRQHLVGGGLGRHDGDPAARLARLRRMLRLIAVVDRHDVRAVAVAAAVALAPGPAALVPAVALPGRKPRRPDPCPRGPGQAAARAFRSSRSSSCVRQEGQGRVLRAALAQDAA